MRARSPLDLHNPLALASVGGVCVVRGAAYMLSSRPLPTWLGAEVGPNIQCIPIWVLGAVWLVIGLYLHLSLVWWGLFRSAIALMAGMYTAWSLVYIADLVVSPDLASIVSLSVYIALVPVTITLGQVEVYKDVTKLVEDTVELTPAQPLER